MGRKGKTILFGIVVVLIILVIIGTRSLFSGDDRESEQDGDLQKIESQLSKMTTEEKVGQLLMPDIREIENKPVTAMQPEIKKMIQDLSPGGIILFRENIESRQQVKQLIASLQEESDIPLLMSIDQEGGLVTRLSYFPDLQGNMAIGATGDEKLAKAAGDVMGRELHQLGFHIDFAPSVDVNVNPLNPVIGVRSFSDDPDLVGKMAAAFKEGLNQAGLMAVAKHFPGHGGVDSDSHYVLPVNPDSIETLRKVELKPFQAMIDKGIGGIMTAHITFPNIETTQLESKKDGLPVYVPATLSPRMIDELLRDKMKFEGLVFTDAMDMKAISDHFGPGEAAVRAIFAGADVILMPEHVKLARDSLIEAVESGRISEERLDESVIRILKVKNRFITKGINDQNGSSMTTEALQLEKKIAEQSVTLVKKGQVLPLSGDLDGSIAIVSSDRSLLDKMKNACWDYHYQFDLVQIEPLKNQNGTLTDAQAKKLEQAAVTIFVTDSATIVGQGDNAWELSTLKDAEKLSKQTILVMARNPYDVSVLPEIDAAIAQYSTETASFKATADVLFGEKEAQGKLPVKLPREVK